MNVDRDFEPAVRAWAALGSEQLPESALDAALDTIAHTPQRRARWPAWRFPVMSNPILRFGVIGAVVLALAAVGVSLLQPSSGSGIGADPEPIPTATPALLDGSDLEARLDPGRYAVGDPFPVPFSIDVPEGWAFYSLTDTGTAFVEVGGDPYPQLGLYRASDVYVDPCRPEEGTRRPGVGEGSSAQDLASDFAMLRGFEASPVTTETVAGRTAYRVTISNSIDTDTAGCTEGALLPIFNFPDGEPASPNGGTTQVIWAVDLGNNESVLVLGEPTPGGDIDTEVQLMEEMVQSIDIP